MKAYAQVNLPNYPANFKFRASTLGQVVTEIFNYAIVIAGIALLGFLIAGGFDLLTSGGSPEGIKRGTNRITYALVGFIIILSAFFILQIAELLFGISVAG
jgi:hypothetical protein